MENELYLVNGWTLHGNYNVVDITANNIYKEHVESRGEKGKKMENYK